MTAEGKITFYEFLLLDEQGLRLKHFHPDLTGWEDKEDFVTFKADDFEDDKIILKGLQFEKISADKMQIRLRLREGDKVHTEIFDMERQ